MAANDIIASDAQQTTPEDDDINLLDLLQVVVDNLRLLILAPLAAGLAALGITFAIAPTFTATTVFMPPQQQQSGAAAMLDTRSNARRALEAVEAYMADGNNLKAAGYTIAGRTLNRYTLADLIALKSHLQAEVQREDAAARSAAGLPDKRRIFVRFGP